MSTEGEHASTGSSHANESGTQRRPKQKPVCRFFDTKKGCREGHSCRFRHPTPSDGLVPVATTQEQFATVEAHAAADPVPPQSIPAPTNKVVTRPTPKALMDDPRAFQINQIQRRFKPEVSEQPDGTTLTFGMKPSDPDFPYEIEMLECKLSVPKTYPAAGRPSLTVQNKDIPRGFQLNIERGFDRIATNSPTAYLLGLMNRLDQQLESILGGQKAETITLVANRAPPPKAEAPTRAPLSATSNRQGLTPLKAEVSIEEITEAKKKRRADVRQLEARFGRLPHYSKSADGQTFTLPFDSPKRSVWPASLQQVRSFQLKVPERYPIDPLEIRLFNDSPEVKAVERSFKERSIADHKAPITQQVNYLSSHVKEMAVATGVEKSTPKPATAPLPAAIKSVQETETTIQSSKAEAEGFDDSHIQHIPRPPEWDVGSGDDDDSSDSYESDEDSAGEDEEGETGSNDIEPSPSSAPAERGILLSLPRLELHGIELLELTSLNLTVKCERCKEHTDIEKLRASPENSKMREATCKKCATTLAIRFRADLIHTNSVRAGYLDLDGCTVVDLLPSSYTPTCSSCSTQYPAPGIVAVRGDNALAICRECHTKMTLKIHEVKFLLVSASAIRASRAPGRNQPKENLGVVAGTELPNRGRCRHYKKSYRWFRFSCCAKVYACDRCHDEEQEHAVEHANRMLCGFCSREQNYRPEDCGVCHMGLTGAKGRGFWEGGKGTRDPARMSRKDPRKYRNRNKATAKKG